MPVGMMLEVLVAVLLVVTIVYCALLDKRLRALRSGQDGLKSLIAELDSVTRRAQSGIGELKVASEAAGSQLSGPVAKARALADELQIMIEAGNVLADRLEGGRAAQAREGAREHDRAGIRARSRMAPASSHAPQSQAPQSDPPQDWDEQLLKALRGAR